MQTRNWATSQRTKQEAKEMHSFYAYHHHCQDRLVFPVHPLNHRWREIGKRLRRWEKLGCWIRSAAEEIERYQTEKAYDDSGSWWKIHLNAKNKQRRSKDVTWTQHRPESPTVTLTCHASKYKEHKLHQMSILRFERILGFQMGLHHLEALLKLERTILMLTRGESNTVFRLFISHARLANTLTQIALSSLSTSNCNTISEKWSREERKMEGRGVFWWETVTPR